jgi:predicted acylesterase/phospholipase RssA
MQTHEAASRWWLDPATVQGLVHGVFEGGGAKGVLYVGALEGVLSRGLWFSAVAGSSAGAITAAMIAAGLRPEDMRARMNEGLQAMALPATVNAYRRLRKASGFLNHAAVRTWLTCVLRTQVQKLAAAPENEGPTFAELFDLTGIELHVVAVDLSGRRVMVFNRTLTPLADVADAVMASATIPIAFEPLIFMTDSVRPAADAPTTGKPEATFASRLIADGGIASNFPSFVFRDEGFRAYAGLASVPDTTPIVGFLLDESPADSKDLREVYRSGRFAATINDIAEEVSSGAAVPAFRRRRTVEHKIGHAIRLGLGWLLYVLEYAMLTPVRLVTTSVENRTVWNWPNPTNRHASLWLAALRSSVSTSSLPLFFGAAAFTIIFWTGFIRIATWLLSLLGDYEFDGLSKILGFIVGLLFSLSALVLAAWMFLLGIGTFVLLRVAYPILGRFGRPLIQTFLQTPAESPWAGYGKNETLVRIKVPSGMTTLGIGPGVDLQMALQDAQDVTHARLGKISATSGAG